MGRPKAKADPAERAALRLLIKQHRGNLSSMAAALGNLDRNGLTRRLKLHGIDKVAARARASAGMTGPRSVASVPEDKDKLAALIAKHGYRDAAQRLGISPRTMVRRMRAAGVTGEQIAGLRGANG